MIETETLKVAVGTDKFTFAAKLTANQSFKIAVTAPQGQTCRSSITAGSIVNVNITNVEVTCVASTYSVGGTVGGLAENETVTLTLSPTGGNAETKDVTGDADTNADEPFTFDTRLPNSAAYTVTTTSPTGKTCTLTPTGEQMIAGADVDNIAVTCVANTYSISGKVSGLGNGDTLTLAVQVTGSGAESKVITADADVSTDEPFAFDTLVPYGATYRVDISFYPNGKYCQIDNTLQTMGAANVDNIAITCVGTHSVSGTVTGADDNSKINVNLLYADSANPVEVSSTNVTPNPDGTFTLTGIPANKVYRIFVISATANEVCTPPTDAYSTTPINADVTGIQITCVIN